MLPSFTSHIIASITLAIPAMILAETALSFLGLGLQPPIVSWGVLLQEAQNIRSHRDRALALRAGRRGGDRGAGAQLPRRRPARRGRPVQHSMTAIRRDARRPLLAGRRTCSVALPDSRRTGVVKAVDGVSLRRCSAGKTLCVVGESGSGKSVTARSILQIVDAPGPHRRRADRSSTARTAPRSTSPALDPARPRDPRRPRRARSR